MPEDEPPELELELLEPLLLELPELPEAVLPLEPVEVVPEVLPFEALDEADGVVAGVVVEAPDVLPEAAPLPLVEEVPDPIGVPAAIVPLPKVLTCAEAPATYETPRMPRLATVERILVEVLTRQTPLREFETLGFLPS